MLIKNTTQLLSSKLDETQLNLRKIGLVALKKAINSVKPKRIIEKSIKIQQNKLIIKNDIYDLNNFEKIYIIGGGKATAEMALSLEEILINYSNIAYQGLINVPEGLEIEEMDLKSKIRIIFASHPIPNEAGLKGTKSMMELVNNSTSKDLIFCLISGGGSALLPLPKENISLEDLQKLNSLLLASGASIHEINTIRKHLSDFKGGNLARSIYNTSKATLISLIISDVVGNDLDSIASGPTVPDSTTFRDAYDLLLSYNLLKKIPKSIKLVIEEGLNGVIEENPKEKDNCFKNTHNFLIGSVNSAVKEIIVFLEKESFEIDYFSSSISGEAKNYAKKIYSKINQKLNENHKNNKKALIATGELTVTIKGDGIGGRNQEMLLSFLDLIIRKDIYYDFLILAVNLDGIEGNSKAMGAIIDNHLLIKVKSKKIDIKKYLENNDSNSFFKTLNCEILTGPTGCNVNDLLLVLIIKGDIENKW